MSRELPEPCKHSHTAWRYRVSSHSDEETADGIPNDRAFCTVWVCEADLEAGRRYVAYYAMCTPHVIEGTRKAAGAA